MNRKRQLPRMEETDMKKTAAMILAGAMIFCGAAVVRAEAPEVVTEAEETIPEGLENLAQGLMNLWTTAPAYGYRGDETVEEQVVYDENGFGT